MSAKPPQAPDAAGSVAPFGHDRYDPADALRLIGTDFVTPATRRALEARLHAPIASQPRFLNRTEFACLAAVVDRLVPQHDLTAPVDLAGAIDRRLARGEGDGWRYDTMAPDGDAFRRGLAAMDGTAQARSGALFVDLPGRDQDRVLAMVQTGDVPGDIWAELRPRLFFEELLAAATEFFYADPRVQASIGYAGFADAHGWRAVGLDGRDGHEPVETSAAGRSSS